MPEGSERDAWARAGWVSTPGIDEEDLLPVPFRAPPPTKARRRTPLLPPPAAPVPDELSAVAADARRRWEERVREARAHADNPTGPTDPTDQE